MESLFNKTPKCLSKFKTEKVDLELTSGWNIGKGFITKKIYCHCRNDTHFLLTSNAKKRKGFFIKKTKVLHLAPVLLKCPKCEMENLLFNPKIHGWDGEQGGSSQLIGKNPPELFEKSAGEVFVNYSYQGEENYNELINEGCLNPEDFFDSFTIYFKRDILRQVVSYECA